MNSTAYEPPASSIAIPNIADPQTWAVHAFHMPRILKACRWWYGDLLVHAPDQTSYVDLLNSTPGIDPSETPLLMTTSERWPIEHRRPDLPWSYHAALNPLAARDLEEACRVLDDAAVSNLTLHDLKEAVSKAKKPARRPARTGGLV